MVTPNYAILPVIPMATPSRTLMHQPVDANYCGCAEPAPFRHATGGYTCQLCELPCICRVCMRVGHLTFACPIPKAQVRGIRAVRQATFEDFPDDCHQPAA